jgi:putative ABC transport system substrate-binding protein
MCYGFAWFWLHESDMRRRSFITLICAAASWPLVGRAQQKGMPVIGLLSGASPGPQAANVAALQQALSETGYVEGKTVAIEYRWAEGVFDMLPALAGDLVAQKVDLIAALSPPAALAAKAATSTIPIVFRSAPIRLRSASSPASPGRAATSPV